MHVISLQSGSNGNCIYVEAQGVRLLFDAGISGSEAQRRLGSRGGDIEQVDGLIVSHEHGDHVRSAGIFHRMFGLPVYVTRKTLAAAAGFVSLEGLNHFRAGETLCFNGVSVETIPTAHDVVDGVAFVIDDGSRRLGILTDLGHVFAGLGEITASLDAIILESNYDPKMLESGSYPLFLKERIRGPHGHISNVESGELLARCASKDLRWACLAHLSANNNNPDLAVDTHRRVWRPKIPLHVASRHHVSEVLSV